MSPIGIQDLFQISDRSFIRPHSLDSLLYIWTPNRGNAAANYDRAKLLAARALAAYSGYYVVNPSSTTPRCRPTHSFDQEGKHSRVHPNHPASENGGQYCHLHRPKRETHPVPNMPEKMMGTVSRYMISHLLPLEQFMCHAAYLSNAPARFQPC